MPHHVLPVHAQSSPLARERCDPPHNYGPLATFNGHARITGPCGDTMEFWVQVEREQLARVGFTTTGCGSSRAAGSMATELATGKTRDEAQRTEQADILTALGGLPKESEHCALLAANTLKAALRDFEHRQGDAETPLHRSSDSVASAEPRAEC